MKTAQLLQTLNDQLSELAALVAPLAEHATLSPRFDRQLFHTRSTLMQDYLAEARQNFSQLSQAVERQQLPQVVWIAERLAAQIAALRRETATWSLRSWDHASPTLSRWQRRRLQHQEYERRQQAALILLMLQATSLDEQQRLGKEVEAYSGRLARCRQALDKIENVLARLTR